MSPSSRSRQLVAALLRMSGYGSAATPVTEDNTDLSESATGNDNRVVQRDQAAFTVIRPGTNCGLVRFAIVSAKEEAQTNRMSKVQYELTTLTQAL